MKPNRRWFQYSLRSFLVLLTASAVWLGVVVNRAHEQREAAKAIEASGCLVTYDWQSTRPKTPCGPHWLRRAIGNEFFQNVESVTFRPFPTKSEIDDLLPRLQQVRPKSILIFTDWRLAAATHGLRAALPHTEVNICSLHVDSSLPATEEVEGRFCCGLDGAPK